jgi:hypothetical protein
VKTPEVFPVTTPETEPTLAIAGLLLDQVPPPVASVKVVGTPIHALAGPAMGEEEAGATVTMAVVKQPSESV